MNNKLTLLDTLILRDYYLDALKNVIADEAKHGPEVTGESHIQFYLGELLRVVRVYASTLGKKTGLPAEAELVS